MHYTAPACGFCISYFFQFQFSTNHSASPRQSWAFARKTKLKRLKMISVFFSLGDLKRIEEKKQGNVIKGVYLLFVIRADQFNDQISMSQKCGEARHGKGWGEIIGDWGN